ncbi:MULTISPECIES: hypothetical protein [Methanobacterium]|jgi:hypothetical protein|uniref:Uncharacterized protein n=1 Tax=Methanobacterium bryantii TaxID=2161 RepID=A0A2A2H797_METBR|nr:MULTISPECIES: hypothetical protein [Methanobacterium]OEC85043.1 hypothetical protein A9507_01585 [Methanobacterium sp. A39]PAV05196.1 hypothetical protein ASJ80_13010 [Methanobacterium bryantii]
MVLVLDPVIIVNLIFCIIIVALGIVGYEKVKSTVPLYIAAAFGLFGISHFATILGYASSLTVLVIIRSLAYIVIIYALYKMAFSR